MKAPFAKTTLREERGLPPRLWPFAAISIALFALHLTSASSEIGGHHGGDSVIYYLLGKAIADGKGYVDLHLPGEPVHTQYPPLFPLLLAPFHLVFEKPLFAMHVMVCFFNALAAAGAGHQIWVAQGVYHPTGLTGPTSRTVSFELKSGSPETIST